MKKTSLVVLAAGMGSRYGGLKQIDEVGPNGEIILELSIFDAVRAGFDKVVFIIKEEIEDAFKQAIGNRVSEHVEVAYVYQDLHALPDGFKPAEGRVKPWGTGHALLCCKGQVDTPFAIINADDYYGRDAFLKMHEFLIADYEEHQYAMVGYRLENTVSEFGSVSRGVCEVKNGKLTNVDEILRIEKQKDNIAYTLDYGETWIALDNDRLVSMNMWGFQPNFIDMMEEDFIKFLQTETRDNPMNSEFYIPKEVDKMLKAKKIEVCMLSSEDKWYGITYQEDKPIVKAGIEKLIQEGKYPVPLWSK
ncbi:MAG: NDP-sugar synthase [Breznakia sp.]